MRVVRSAIRLTAATAVLGAALAAISLGAPSTARAQGANGDFTTRALFRTPEDGYWGEGTSVGHAEFRVTSRYMQFYYGGVRRVDEFRFVVSLSFDELPDFETEFAGSRYNTNYDVYIEDDFVGRVLMNQPTMGFGDLQYDSRHPTPPQLPLPANFPDPVETGMTVSVYFATGPKPAIGSPRPSGSPILSGVLGEAFDRGDVDQDDDVDIDDFAFLVASYDPQNTSGPHIGPANGDFTGDNRSDANDYFLFAQNWNGEGPVPVLNGLVGAPLAGAGAEFRLGANQPNPFSRSTTLRFSLPVASDVTLDVVDVTGARVARIEKRGLAAGSHTVVFDGRDSRGRALPNGTYFVRAAAGGATAVRSMIVVH